MTKKDLIATLVQNENLSPKRATQIVDMIFTEMATALGDGRDVNIQDFGRLAYKTTAARVGRNPATGEPLQIPEKTTVKFKPAKKLSDFFYVAPVPLGMFTRDAGAEPEHGSEDTAPTFKVIPPAIDEPDDVIDEVEPEEVVDHQFNNEPDGPVATLVLEDVEAAPVVDTAPITAEPDGVVDETSDEVDEARAAKTPEDYRRDAKRAARESKLQMKEARQAQLDEAREQLRENLDEPAEQQSKINKRISQKSVKVKKPRKDGKDPTDYKLALREFPVKMVKEVNKIKWSGSKNLTVKYITVILFMLFFAVLYYLVDLALQAIFHVAHVI